MPIGDFLTDLATSAVQSWDEHARRKRTPPSGGILRHSTTLLVAGIVGFIFGSGATAWILWRLGNEGLWLPAGFGGFGLFGLLTAIVHRRVRCQLTARGFDVTPLLSRRIQVQWSEIERVEWSRWSYVVFRLQDGRVARVSTALVGMPWFSGLILAKVPRKRFDADAGTKLGKVANGGVVGGFGQIF